MVKKLRKIPNLHLLNQKNDSSLPIFSFLILNQESNLYLHHNFVSVLLNDLFGLQTRAGCSCAGIWAFKLLGLETKTQNLYLDFEKVLTAGEHENKMIECLRPGFTRLNFSFYLDTETIDFIIDCIKFVSAHGWKFLTQYSINEENGEFKHFSAVDDQIDLQDFDLMKKTYRLNLNNPAPDQKLSYGQLLDHAYDLLEQGFPAQNHQPISQNVEKTGLRSWLSPYEADLMLSDSFPTFPIRKFTVLGYDAAQVTPTDLTISNFHKTFDSLIVDIKNDKAMPAEKYWPITNGMVNTCGNAEYLPEYLSNEPGKDKGEAASKKVVKKKGRR